MPAITAEALDKIPGVKAKYICTGAHKYLMQNKCRIDLAYGLDPGTIKKNPLRYIFSFLANNFLFRPLKFLTLCRWIIWADAIHWTWDSTMKNNLDLWLTKFLNKKRFIEWVGSEMRVPEVTMQENKGYKEAYNNGYEYKDLENKERSYALQEKFASYGFVPILVPEMKLFLKPGLFNKVYTTQYRIFQPEKYPDTYFPAIQNDKIIIAHSPSAKIAKGSNIIIPLIEKLKQQFNIEFILLHNVAREQVIETMKRCDIFIDQIILGSYAAAAIEAMSLGKPVVAYIMPPVFREGTPIDCPIVNANPDTLEINLIELLRDSELRRSIGIKSRQYVEEVHNADKLAHDLLKIYNS
jgi:glycosyltransferase involved in cell wall biosynthesis